MCKSEYKWSQTYPGPLKKYAGANAVVCAYILAAEEAEAGRFLKARSSRLA